MTMTQLDPHPGPAPLGEVHYELHKIGVQMCSVHIPEDGMYCDEPVTHVIVRSYIGTANDNGNAEGGKDEVGRYCAVHARAALAKIARS